MSNTIDMTKEEFVTRFVAELVRLTDPRWAEYGRDAGGTYWDDPAQRADGPEACAAIDVSYWEHDGDD